jgi:hypothetical protein
MWRAQRRIARPVFPGEPLRDMLPLAPRRRRLTASHDGAPRDYANGRGSDHVDWLLAAATVSELFAGRDDGTSVANTQRVGSAPPVPTNVSPDHDQGDNAFTGTIVEVTVAQK